MRRISLGALGLDRGGHLLVKQALRSGPVTVDGEHPELAMHLRVWARAKGHGFRTEPSGFVLTPASTDRWRGAVMAGTVDTPVENPSPTWGFAARGASVEIGTAPLAFRLSDREDVWTEDAARLYAQAAGAQWDPAAAVDWDDRENLPEEVEDAVVQVMTYLLENETAALLVPARFLGQLHPHFREIQQVLAITVADEARHIEVFSRRATLYRKNLGLSTAGGQASLATLLEEPDFALASFLLSVLGEGSFLSLLRFLAESGPDRICRTVCRLAAQDEARHVAFGMAHLERHAREDGTLLARLAAAVERRHTALQHTAGLNEEVFDALVILAAGGFSPAAISQGWDRVMALQREMDHGRRVRLARLGFGEREAEALSGLHTRNFM